MVIKDLELHNFRNYSSLNLEFSQSINVIYGKNGYGKTNLLEAMFLCCVGKSFKAQKDAELIKYGEDSYKVKTRIGDSICNSISVFYEKNKSKYIEIDGVYIDKLRMLFGNLIGIMFSPESMRMVTDGPMYRRRLLDIALCQIKKDYYYSLMMYNRFCEEKGKLLEQGRIGDNLELEVINENIAKFGAVIAVDRNDFVRQLNEIAGKYYSFITDEEEMVTMRYYPNIHSMNAAIGEKTAEGEPAEFTVEKVKNDFLEELTDERLMKRERDFKKNLIGIQRDDIGMDLCGNSLRSFGSQGQKRSYAISITMAELEILRQKSGRTPVLFLDDVLSELDNARKSKIVELTKNIQTFYTCTDREMMRLPAGGGASVNFIDVEKLR